MLKNYRARKSLIFSFWEGFFSACMSGLVTDYVTPYAIALKATTRQIGMLTALPFLASSLVQLKSAWLTERFRSRLKTITFSILLHAFMLLPMVLIPYVPGFRSAWMLVFFYTLFIAFSTLPSPVLSSLMAEYIPPNARGKYFGWRNRALSIVTILFSFLAGFTLQRFKDHGLLGFTIIFAIAFLCRVASWFFLVRMYDPPFRMDKGAGFNLLNFLKGGNRSNLSRFVFFVAGMHFCVNLAAPFFSVFMLKDLKLSYPVYTLLVTTVTVVMLLTIGRWGRIADKVGTAKVLRTTAVVISSLPLWWIVSQNVYWLIFAQVLSGFAWAGFNLCTGNFIYDAVPEERRIQSFAYLSVLVGFGVFLGGFIGGQLAGFFPNIFGYRLLSLFLFSSILRFLVVFFLGRQVAEVKERRKIAVPDLFLRVAGFRRLDAE